MADRNILTTNELLAMGEDDYMNDEQLAFFRNLLENMERQITGTEAAIAHHLTETEYVSDAFDRATIEEEHALSLRTRDRDHHMLLKVRESLRRIDEGDYGFCLVTGEPIGLRRLLARPTATLTVEAQARMERHRKVYGE